MNAERVGALRCVVAASGRDFLELVGPEAEGFLQGQASQDIAALKTGESAWSFVLQPAGKLDALVRVTRLGTERFIVDVDEGFGEAVEARLRKFVLRTKVEIHARTWQVLAVRGRDSEAVDAATESLVGEVSAEFVTAANWPGLCGFDVVGGTDQFEASAVEARDWAIAGNEHTTWADASELKALRVACGVPAMGKELDEKTIPNEVAINDLAVSFTKGCYTGQELVARIDSRGNRVPRKLVGLIFDPQTRAVDGSLLVDAGAPSDNKPHGVVASVARSETLAATLGLGWLRRDAAQITEAAVELPSGVVCDEALVRVVELPMLENLTK